MGEAFRHGLSVMYTIAALIGFVIGLLKRQK